MFSYVFLAFESNSTFILASVVGVFTHRIFLFQPSILSSGTLFLASFCSLLSQKIEKKQSISFVAASVIALQASPALAMNAIELTDKRAENVGGLQLIYEVCISSFAWNWNVFVSETFARAALCSSPGKKREFSQKPTKTGWNKRDFLRHPIFNWFVCSLRLEDEKRVRYLRGIFSYQQVFFFFSLLLQQARDLNINESTRGDGASRFALQKLSTEQTAARAKEATARLSGEVSEYVNKKYWTQAGNALRRAVYTLRFDVNNLVAEKGGDADAAKDLFKTIESLDFAIRSKDLDTASPLAAAAASKADAILAAF